MKKRIVALLLCLLMAMSILPATALADDGSTVIYTGSDWPFSRYYVASLSLSGATVDYVDGYNVYLNAATAADAAVTLTATAGGSSSGNLGINWNDDSTNTKTYTTNLVGGEATVKVYAYKASGAGVSRNGTKTFYLHTAEPNEKPTLAEGISATAEVSVTSGESYSLDLSKVFADADGDALSYTVSVNGAAAVAADVAYSYLNTIPGSYTLVFKATDGKTADDAMPVHTVTLQVLNSTVTYPVTVSLPEGVSGVRFYAVNQVSGSSVVIGDELSYADGTVSVPENISRIAWTCEGYQCLSAEVSSGAVLNLQDVSFRAKTEAGDEDAAATVSIKDAAGVSVSGSVSDHYLLPALTGFTYTVSPSSSYSGSYNAAVLTTQTPATGTVDASFALKHFTVTAPAGSVVSAGTLSNYFVYRFADPISSVTEGDTVTYKFAPLSGKCFIRVQRPNDPDAVSYWDYNTLSDGKSYTITEDMLFMNDGNAFDAKTQYRDFSQSIVDVADVYLTGNEKGYLNLAVGGTHELNIVRDWMIIENIANSMVPLPDVHYQVIDFNGNASNVVTVTPDKNNSSVATITANQEGTAVVLVTYDAVYTTKAVNTSSGMGTMKPTRFSAIWPENTGVLVVSVGADGSTIATNMTINEDRNTNTATGKKAGDKLDAEHDVLYYTGTAGASYSFSPEAGCIVSVARCSLTANSLTYSGFTTQGVSTDEDGLVTVSGLTTGNHIIRVEKDGLASYQVVAAKETSYTITDAAGNAVTADTKVKPGDKLTVQFSQLYNPVNKMSGIYNTNCGPAYMGQDGTVFSGRTGTYGVYNFASDKSLQDVQITIPDDWTESSYTLYGFMHTAGFGDAPGNHRTVRYATGKSVNTTAAATNSYLGLLPQITLAVDVTVTGDLSGDGAVTAADAAAVYAAFNQGTVLDEEQLAQADANGDGRLSPVDAALIYAFVNGKISQLPYAQ